MRTLKLISDVYQDKKGLYQEGYNLRMPSFIQSATVSVPLVTTRNAQRYLSQLSMIILQALCSVKEGRWMIFYPAGRIYCLAHALSTLIIINRTCQHLLLRASYGSTYYPTRIKPTVTDICTVPLGIRRYKS